MSMNEKKIIYGSLHEDGDLGLGFIESKDEEEEEIIKKATKKADDK